MTASELYEKYAPRWFKVIRWRDNARLAFKHHKMNYVYFYIPFTIWWFCNLDPYVKALVFNRPGTEEERLMLKERYNRNPHVRGYELDEYELQRPPTYDTWMRRRNYPEHYGDKYNTFMKNPQP